MNSIKLLSVLFLLLATLLCRAQDQVYLTTKSQEVLVADAHRKLLKDSLSNYNIEYIIQQDFELDHIDYDDNPDWNVASFWFKTSITNLSLNDSWVFEIPDMHIDELDFFFINKNEIDHKVAGANYQFRKRDLNHKNFSFLFRLSEGESGTVYLKIKSKHSYGTSFKIRSYHNFTQYSLNEYLLLGFYYGILVIIILNNLFVYLSLKESVYLWYIGYVVLLGLRSLGDDGLGAEYIWSNLPGMSRWVGQVVPIALLVVFLIYSHVFLEAKKHSALRYRLLNRAVVGYCLFYIFDQLFGLGFYSNLLYAIPFFLIYINSILILRSGYRPARFFVLGYTLLIISFVINYFRSIGAFSEGTFLFLLMVYSTNIGFLIEAMILSIAMGDKFKSLEKDKKLAQKSLITELKRNEQLSLKVNRELEQKVHERTIELKKSNELLQESTNALLAQSDQINQMNIKLDLANRQLEKNAKKVIEDRLHLKGIGFDDFIKIYPDDRSCYKLLSTLKWSEKYACPKCGNEKYSNGNGPYARKCSKCTYNESVKVNTIFQGLRFETVKAFYLVFLVIDSRGEISSYDLAAKLGLRQKTCWAFKKKITQHMKKMKLSYDECKDKGWTELVVINIK